MEYFVGVLLLDGRIFGFTSLCLGASCLLVGLVEFGCVAGEAVLELPDLIPVGLLVVLS